MDILTRVKGISFDRAWERRSIKAIEGVRVPVVSLDDLILSKKAAGRSIDLQDLKILRSR